VCSSDLDGTRMFGKYPIGWPAVLAVFDRLHIGFLANAVLSGLVAVLTGLLAAQFTTKRIAIIAALLYGLSPWAWYNGAHFASHVASTAAVTGFLWMFLRTYNASKKTDSRGLPWASAIGAGLFLGAGVLVRPFDAAMFAMPAVAVTLVLLIRQPNAVICYRISDGKAFREVFQTDKNSIPPNPDSWELPTAKVHFERWFDDVSSQAYAVQISTAVVYNNHEHSFDKLANSHVFFLNALGGSPEVK